MPDVILVVDQGFANSFNARFAKRDLPGETRDKTFTVPVFIDVGPPGPPSFQPYGFWCQWNMTDADWADFLEFVIESKHKVNEPTGADISYYFADDFSPQQVLADLSRKAVQLVVDIGVGP
jgi:hypothetical protein